MSPIFHIFINMKRLTSVIIIILLYCSAGSAQELKRNAIGIRFGGGNGAFTQISYQYRFDKSNRLQTDLGFSFSAEWSSWDFEGLYHRVLPIKDNFKWYVGAGLVTGYWNQQYVDNYGGNGGMYLAGAITIGAEYVFPGTPFQIAADITPQIGMVNYNGSVGGGFGFAFRYVF